jgi:lipopolysaccharide/colanic/teichoic acid biosynthesis glycosyltransferase
MMEQHLMAVRPKVGTRISEPTVEPVLEAFLESPDKGRNGERDSETWPDASLAPAIPASRGYLISKRLIDIVGALLGLILLSPLFLALALLVRLDSPGRVFYRRRVLARQTYHPRALAEFDAFKFRTMIPNAEEYLLADAELFNEYRKEYKLIADPRVTRVGALLRRLSLDELPQLLNILRGQMSLVGPRMITAPELINYENEGPQTAARLLSVPPGLTGLWQVSGRTNISYKERVRLDMEYIDSRSLRLDLQILLRTIGCVIRRQGAV